jgi:hypothetical protein
MTGAIRNHSCSVLSVRVPPCHGDLLLPMQFMALTLTRMTPMVMLKWSFPATMLRSDPFACDGSGATIRLGTKRPE